MPPSPSYPTLSTLSTKTPPLRPRPRPRQIHTPLARPRHRLPQIRSDKHWATSQIWAGRSHCTGWVQYRWPRRGKHHLPHSRSASQGTPPSHHPPILLQDHSLTYASSPPGPPLFLLGPPRPRRSQSLQHSLNWAQHQAAPGSSSPLPNERSPKHRIPSRLHHIHPIRQTPRIFQPKTILRPSQMAPILHLRCHRRANLQQTHRLLGKRGRYSRHPRNNPHILALRRRNGRLRRIAPLRLLPPPTHRPGRRSRT